MKGKYRGCDIEVERGGAEFLTFAVFDDGYEVTSGFSESSDTVRDYYSYMKSVVSSLKDYDRETAEQRMYVASRSYLSVCISIASLSLCEAS